MWKNILTENPLRFNLEPLLDSALPASSAQMIILTTSVLPNMTFGKIKKLSHVQNLTQISNFCLPQSCKTCSLKFVCFRAYIFVMI